jgi:hypothetical protein
MGMLSRSGRGGLARAGGIAGVGLGVIDGGLTYFDRRANHPEESAATSALYAAGDVALWTFLPHVAFAKMGYDVAKSAGEAGAFNKNASQQRMMNYQTQGASWQYNDTQTAATMRQRGLDAMMQSRSLAASAVGGEARRLHRGAL